MDLEVVGRHALLFDDDATASFVNSKEALVEWNSLFIDRYDVRHLLSSPPSSFLKHRQKSSSSPPSDSHLESELDLERYVDLPSPSDEPETDTGVEAAGYHAVPFLYGNTADSTDQKNADVDLENAGFHPHFPVPESLLGHLPPTEKVHQIVARTALFVSKHGGQSEIVLRVKQGDNPTFGFLMLHHHLHPYFRYLVDHQNLLKIDIGGSSHMDGMDGNQTGSVGNGGALSLLGSVYGGEDEDVAVESEMEAKQMDSVGTSDAGDVSNLHHSEQKNPSGSSSQKEEAVSKLPHPSKDKAPVSSKQRNTAIIKAGSSSSKKNEVGNSGSFNSIVEKSKSLAASLSKVESLVIEPPSDLKRLVDRIVEIILKNGKEFEAVLIEQDKKHGRFPFLLPSNQYHSYYLKALKRAQESKLSGKNPITEDGPSWQVIDKKASANDSDHDLPHEFDRKEKFKMVIGKSKKDTQDQPSKGTQQQVAVSVDAAAAAAILQAAIRGIKNPSLEILSKIPLNGYHGLGSEGQASSFGGQPQGSVRKPNESGQPSITVPIAKEIAKTAALAAAGEADSSEAGLTREQKLKAERLKRAKMFAAMIRGGTIPSEKEPLCGLSVEPLGSGVSGSGTEILGQDKGKGSSAPADTGNSDKAEISKKKHSDDGDAERPSRKNRHYRSRIHEDEEEGEEEEREEYDNEGEQMYSRKKNRSSHSSRHHRDHSKHRKRHSSSRSKESRHRHKRDSSSEDVERHHQHKHESSEDEHRSGRHRHETFSEDDHQKKIHRHKHDSSEDEHKKTGRHKHESFSEDEHRKKSSRHKREKGSRHKHDRTVDENKKSRRRKHESSSEDEHLKTNHSHKHDYSTEDENGDSRRSSKLRKRSQSEEGELEEGEIRIKISDQSPSSMVDGAIGEASVDVLNSNQDKRAPSQPLETTEVSEDLRAKIRAMLLATL